MGLDLVEGNGGLDAVDIDVAGCRGRIYLQGAQVTSFVPNGAAHDVLYVSPKSAYQPGKAIRGGIPLCAPWFGAGVRGDRSPQHGFFRTSDWTLQDMSLDGDDAICVLGLEGRKYGADLSATLSAKFGRTLQLRLAVTAHEPMADVETLFHAYLRVSEVEHVSVRGLDGAAYTDKATGGAAGEQHGDLLLRGEIDRVHDTPGPLSVIDQEWARRTDVAAHGCDRFVVWNPGQRVAAGMADLEGGWRDFVCVEPGAVAGAAYDLAAGQSRTLDLTLQVAAL